MGYRPSGFVPRSTLSRDIVERGTNRSTLSRDIVERGTNRLGIVFHLRLMNNDIKIRQPTLIRTDFNFLISEMSE